MLHIPSRRDWSLQLYDSLFLLVTRYKTWKFLAMVKAKPVVRVRAVKKDSKNLSEIHNHLLICFFECF
ncbi:hypothetical protein NC652_025670 [Populus alba x Populus x berolinensis]|nr:hypothetical protein NC652_025670 [Populus alba x Populus x berolinensis]